MQGRWLEDTKDVFAQYADGKAMSIRALDNE